MLSTTLRRSQSSEQGFTLIEILVVILIIGILAAIAIPIFLNQRKVAVDASVESDMRNAITLVDTHKKELFEGPTRMYANFFFLNTEDGVKAYSGLQSNDYDENDPDWYPTFLLDDKGYPIGDPDKEVNLPGSLKDLKLSEGTILTVFYLGKCHYEMNAVNNSGNVSKPDQDTVMGGYIYLPFMGKIYDAEGFYDEDGPYNTAASQPGFQEYHDSNAC